MALKPGEAMETAVWLTGTETDEMKRGFEREVRAGLAEMASHEGIIIGPLIVTEKKPGEDRVPAVPDHLHGPDVRLMVFETKVVGNTFKSEGMFIADLDPKDLERLRAILRRVHQDWNPGKPELSTEKCDEYINRNGPDAALAALRETVH